MKIKVENHHFKSDDGIEFVIRRAHVRDAKRIQELYLRIYGSNYSMKEVTDTRLLMESLKNEEFYYLLVERGHRLVGCVVYEVDYRQRLGKAFGAVVDRGYRGHNLAQYAAEYGKNLLLDKLDIVDSIYATTRTVTPAPQKTLTNLGFVNLGIFPNVRKVHDFETHCLSVYLGKKIFEKREGPIKLIPELKNFYKLVQEITGIEDAIYEGAPLTSDDFHKKLSQQIDFEIIDAEGFILDRFNERRDLLNAKRTHFYPFHKPNILLWSKHPAVEVYCYFNEQDKYAVIVGFHMLEELDRISMLQSAVQTLKRLNVRYLEILVDSCDPVAQKAAIITKFIPSAYYPGIRLKRTTGRRHDYWVFSRTFEMLDFSEIKLDGVNRKYLLEFYKIWKMRYIDSFTTIEG